MRFPVEKGENIKESKVIGRIIDHEEGKRFLWYSANSPKRVL